MKYCVKCAKPLTKKEQIYCQVRQMETRCYYHQRTLEELGWKRSDFVQKEK